VVTDYLAFAYLMDIFITPSHQKKGSANLLMNFVLKQKFKQSKSMATYNNGRALFIQKVWI